MKCWTVSPLRIFPRPDLELLTQNLHLALGLQEIGHHGGNVVEGLEPRLNGEGRGLRILKMEATSSNQFGDDNALDIYIYYI